MRSAITSLYQQVSAWITTGELQCLNRDEGQGLTEYALVLALIAIVAIAALTLLGGKVTSALSTVGNSLTR
jgi:pilus assembly protein Flp/PilA